MVSESSRYVASRMRPRISLCAISIPCSKSEKETVRLSVEASWFDTSRAAFGRGSQRLPPLSVSAPTHRRPVRFPARSCETRPRCRNRRCDPVFLSERAGGRTRSCCLWARHVARQPRHEKSHLASFSNEVPVDGGKLRGKKAGFQLRPRFGRVCPLNCAVKAKTPLDRAAFENTWWR